MKIKKWIKGIGVIAVLGCTLFSAYAESVFVSANSATVVDYKETDVLDDLKVLPSFSAENFPKKTIDELGYPKAETIFCSEYCYADYSIYDEYYGLYLYVYNPTQTPIYKNGHFVNMAIDYDADGKPTDYLNIPLEMLDISDDAIMNNRFIKFRVSDKEKEFIIYDEDGEAEKVNLLEFTRYYADRNENKRRYDIAGVQIAFGDGWYTLDSTCGRTYYFEGFSKGLSSESLNESTLVCTSDYLDTISLEVQHTYYRANAVGDTLQYVDNTAKFITDELNTVYFSIPEEDFEEYGNRLQKIKAEWYEYKTKEIFVTSDETAYNQLNEYIGQYIYDDRQNTILERYRNDDVGVRVIWGERILKALSTQHFFEGSYNPCIDGDGDGVADGWFDFESGNYYYAYSGMNGTDFVLNNVVGRMDWLFLVDDVGGKNDFRISADKVIEYMEAYTEKHNYQGTVETSGNAKYATGLFADSVDLDRQYLFEDKAEKRGHVVQIIDADNEEKLLFAQDKSWWEKQLGWKQTEYEDESYTPIYDFVFEAQKNDANKDINAIIADLRGMSSQSFGAKYYVNSQDAEKVQAYCISELEKGNRPILFRFAQTDYYAAAARFDLKDSTWLAEQNGYVAQETMFLGFDIIDLTFRKDNNEETVIAVVSNPTDIINGLDPAPSLGEYSHWSIGTFLTNVLIFAGVSGGAFVVFLIGKKIIDHYRE